VLANSETERRPASEPASLRRRVLQTSRKRGISPGYASHVPQGIYHPGIPPWYAGRQGGMPGIPPGYIGRQGGMLGIPPGYTGRHIYRGVHREAYTGGITRV